MESTIGEYINALRTESSMTLTKLAAALDIDQSTLSKIENGKRPVSESIIPKLATVFNLDLDHLTKHYYAEKVAEVLLKARDLNGIFEITEEKIKHLKKRKEYQGKLDL